MNIKQFLLIKACDKLPSDVRDLIWKQVEISAADIIRKIYLLKVSRNVDIFLKMLNFSNSNNSYYHRHISNYFKYNNNKITYKYIQEPGTWIDHLEDIIQIYRTRDIHFESNQLYAIINKVTDNNEIYQNTGIAYWNNL